MRGFDYLMSPAGLTMIALGVVLVLAFIVVGGIFMRSVAREEKKRRR
jgi:flagellar basal body-associated protein FliL